MLDRRISKTMLHEENDIEGIITASSGRSGLDFHPEVHRPNLVMYVSTLRGVAWPWRRRRHLSRATSIVHLEEKGREKLKSVMPSNTPVCRSVTERLGTGDYGRSAEKRIERMGVSSSSPQDGNHVVAENDELPTGRMPGSDCYQAFLRAAAVDAPTERGCATCTRIGNS